MARRVRSKRDGKPKGVDGGEATGVEAIRGNGYDKVMTQEFVDQIEENQATIDEIMQAARDKCAPIREDINAIKKDAHEKGLPRRELNAVLSKRRALAKADAIREKLSAEQQDNFDQIEQALGMLLDTPLGAAAMEAAGAPA
jgi:vacuolar-type H+-ATPase subunit E/Vma4